MLPTPFKLRRWSPDDIHSLVKYANNQKIAQNMTDMFPHPYGESNARAFIEFASKDEGHKIFAIEVNGEAVGGVGLHFQTDISRLNAELGYWLGEPFWGKGIVTGAIREIVMIGFENYPINRIFARPFGRNMASQRALEKAGFKLEARFEKTIIKQNILEDELVYAIRRTGDK